MSVDVHPTSNNLDVQHCTTKRTSNDPISTEATLVLHPIANWMLISRSQWFCHSRGHWNSEHARFGEGVTSKRRSVYPCKWWPVGIFARDLVIVMCFHLHLWVDWESRCSLSGVNYANFARAGSCQMMIRTADKHSWQRTFRSSVQAAFESNMEYSSTNPWKLLAPWVVSATHLAPWSPYVVESDCPTAGWRSVKHQLFKFPLASAKPDSDGKMAALW